MPKNKNKYQYRLLYIVLLLYMKSSKKILRLANILAKFTVNLRNSIHNNLLILDNIKPLLILFAAHLKIP